MKAHGTATIVGSSPEQPTATTVIDTDDTDSVPALDGKLDTEGDSFKEASVRTDDSRELPTPTSSALTLRQTAAVLLVIQETTEVDKVMAALKNLEHILSLGHEEVVDLLETNQASISIVGVMRRFSDNIEMQQIGCRLLCVLAEESSTLRLEMVQINLQHYLIQIITENITDQVIQLSANRILAILLRSESVHRQLEASDDLARLASLLDLAIGAFRDQSEIQREACTALYQLINYSHQLHDHFIGTSSNILLEVLKTSADYDILNTVIQTFHTVARNGNCLPELVEKGLHVFAMDLCTQCPNQEHLVTSLLELLVSLSQDATAHHVLVEGDFVMAGLCVTLGLNKTSQPTQLAGLRLFNALAPMLLTRNQPEVSCQSFVRVIYNAMFNLLGQLDIQEAGCLAVTNLLKYRPEANRWIGEEPEDEQQTLHTLCIAPILMFDTNVEVFIAACEALYWIAADNDRLCHCLMSKNVHIAVLGALKIHYLSSEAAETSCRVLRGLCIFNDEHKNRVIRDGGFPALVSIMRLFTDDIHVQAEVISAITCLADINMIRYQCILEKVHEDCILCMQQFKQDEIIQEAAIEAFTVLAGADTGVEMMIKANAHIQTVAAMKNFPKNIRIQRKGMIALQLFVSREILGCNEFSLNATLAITTAMRNFSLSKSLLMEAYVAIQLLSEDSPDVASQFVLIGCQEIIFNTLYTTDENDDLYKIACECLYVLALEQNMKSQMLLYACRKGSLQGFECLIRLGADVNLGEKKNTPLYQAVCSQNEDIIQLILTQEVHNFLKPLSKSLTLGNETISGMILSRLGFDSENSCITWSDLRLDRLSPEWLRVTLAHTGFREGDTVSGLVKKIKDSEKIRHKRQRHSSDRSKEQMFETSHHRMRHPITKTQTLYPPVTLIGPSQTSTQVSVSDDVVLGFELSPYEAEEWKKDTLTGANVPFSPRDPRQRQQPESKRRSGSEHYETLTDVWTRKRCRSPRSSEFLDRPSWLLDGVPMPIQAIKHLRKMSEPDLGYLVKRSALPRKLSFGSLQESEVEHTGPHIYHLLVLDVSINSIQSLQPLADADVGLLQQFSYLEKLNLSANNLSSLPDTLFTHLPSLKELDVHGNRLETFPVAVLGCSHLKQLLLARNKIKALDGLHCNDSLHTLDLSYNCLTTLPEQMGATFPNLSELLLDNNDLVELPCSPLGMKKLKKLSMSHNDIGKIPEDFLRESTSLVCLDASYNHLDSLPSSEVASLLQRFNKLKVRKNQLSEKEPFFIPKFVLALPCLRVIDLSENNLNGLPAVDQWKSTMLREVLMAKNKITKLPLDVSKDRWNRVEKLNLANNKLTELPKEIGNLTYLSSLDITYNNITTLPDELGKCQRMWEMPLAGLDLDLNRQLLKRRVKDIISYLHNRLKKAQSYYRMKLMVVGYGGRGKSTLLHTLMKKGAMKKKENQPTVGVIVEDWKYQWYERKKKRNDEFSNSWRWTSGKKVVYTLNTWDFAGQEEFYSTHQCYLSNRAIYLVVFDLHKGMSDIDLLKPWLASIHSRAPGCPVIVVGTHIDKLSQDKERRSAEINTISERLKEYNTTPGFPGIQAALLVDGTQEDKNMHDLRSTIMDIVDNYQIRGKRVMGEKVPSSYVLADRLSEEAKSLKSTYPVIRHRQLLQIVNEARLDLQEEELDQAVSFLHDSGVLLHYEDTTQQLRDFYFIDPGWLCRMMAQIITVKQINPFINREGIMKIKHVHLLFRDKSFPDSLLQQYITLLQKFEIALPHSEDEMMIPCRLPEARPMINLPVSKKHEKICRIYRMPYTPIGLWYRVISRMVTLTSSTAILTLLKLAGNAKKVCWRQGMYVLWAEDAFVLLDSYREQAGLEGVQITVPVSLHGSRLLGHVVDHIDALIDEWYPGLASIDPILGHEIVERLAPCPHCPEDQCHMFTLKDLQICAEHSDFIVCPDHHSNVQLSLLAPDLVMSDIDMVCQMDNGSLTFDESADSCLGNGGFGSVFKGQYNGKEVAVKMFMGIADIHPLKMLRQEAAILRCLDHPSIVSMVGFGIRPPVIVLELATLGSLGSLLKNSRIMKPPLQNRIALQVAEGLTYLHQMMIVYRDMKPDNVLIFSDSLSVEVNAKISDYGISRFATLEGLKAQEGTLAYRAPEVIRKENYSFKADVFSYGLTIYVMLTSGRHPFDHLESKGEMDRSVAEQTPIPPLVMKGAPHWPDMHSLVSKCLQFDPDGRPKASDIWQHLRGSEFMCLQRVIPVSRVTTVECLTVQESSKRELSLWVASGDLSSFQISQISLTDPQKEIKGTHFKHGRILCLEAVGDRHLVMGTQLGRVWVFNTATNTILHASAQLPDSVLCLKYIKGDKEGGVLLAGLGNGKVAVFPVVELLEEKSVDPFCLGPGHDDEPVCCLERLGKHVYLSCGAQIVILCCSKDGLTFEKFIDTQPKRNNISINALAVGKGVVVFSTKFSGIIQLWDNVCEKITKTADIEKHLRTDKFDRVTALMVQENKFLWVGTHNGLIAVFDIATMSVLVSTHRYVRSVRSLFAINNPGLSAYRGVLSGGLGYRENPGQENEQENMYGCVLQWDWNMAHHATMSMEYEKKRCQLEENFNVST